MSVSNETQIRILRTMAWQRAKGELYSMLETFYNNVDQFEALKKEIAEFVNYVENNALQE